MSKPLEIEVYQTTNNTINDYGFPEPLRCLILGSSGCGKTTLMLNFIFQWWLKFERVIIFSTTLHQKIYEDLRNAQALVNEKNKGFVRDKKYIEMYDNVKNIEEIEGNNILVVFDDLMLENQKEIGKYFVVGRHRNFHCLFLAQSYGKVSRQTIKSNLNYLCLFKQPHFYLKQIHEDFMRDKDFNEIVKECEEIWCGEAFNFKQFAL